VLSSTLTPPILSSLSPFLSSEPVLLPPPVHSGLCYRSFRLKLSRTLVWHAIFFLSLTVSFFFLVWFSDLHFFFFSPIEGVFLSPVALPSDWRIVPGKTSLWIFFFISSPVPPTPPNERRSLFYFCCLFPSSYFGGVDYPPPRVHCILSRVPCLSLVPISPRAPFFFSIPQVPPLRVFWRGVSAATCHVHLFWYPFYFPTHRPCCSLFVTRNFP